MRRPAYLALVPAALLAGTAPAYAYLDPGTGSMILQALLGGAAGVAIAGKLYWRRFMVMIGMRRDDAPPAEQGKPRADP
ncbi:hypothetical protein [Amaricoccus sp.]|uniref:hypothetical protein n=1 Tax=Amaricoccus sp. TaxID=1872485 RepID=UPI001B62B2BB|nr:hypothetical protein [Amaricoccus sp.]MBP7242316.1 hypothetical protein [Amaricoccus sp.]